MTLNPLATAKDWAARLVSPAAAIQKRLDSYQDPDAWRSSREQCEVLARVLGNEARRHAHRPAGGSWRVSRPTHSVAFAGPGDGTSELRPSHVAGDLRSQLVRQITTAVGDATTAVFVAERYLKERNGSGAGSEALAKSDERSDEKADESMIA